MAVYNTSQYNGGQTKSDNMTRLIRSFIRTENTNIKITPLTSGDVLAIGDTPDGSYVTGLKLMIEEAFPTGTTLDIGSFNEADTFVPFATGVMVEADNVHMTLPLPLSGVVIWDTGLAETDPQNGGYWGGTRLAVRINGAGIDGTNLLGVGFLLVEYSYYRSGNLTDQGAVDTYYKL